MTSSINTAMGLREWAMLVTLSILWGGSFFFVGVAVNDFPPLTIVTLRVGHCGYRLVDDCSNHGASPSEKPECLAGLPRDGPAEQCDSLRPYCVGANSDCIRLSFHTERYNAFVYGNRCRNATA